MILLTMVSLGKFIEDELARSGMSQADLARKSGLDTGWISNLISGTKQLGLKSMVGLSKGLGVPTDMILRAAGLLPQVPTKTEQSEQLLYLFNQLKDKDKQTILQMAEFLLNK